MSYKPRWSFETIPKRHNEVYPFFPFKQRGDNVLFRNTESTGFSIYWTHWL
jgi:hypothetical protein